MPSFHPPQVWFCALSQKLLRGSFPSFSSRFRRVFCKKTCRCTYLRIDCHSSTPFYLSSKQVKPLISGSCRKKRKKTRLSRPQPPSARRRSPSTAAARPSPPPPDPEPPVPGPPIPVRSAGSRAVRPRPAHPRPPLARVYHSRPPACSAGLSLRFN